LLWTHVHLNGGLCYSFAADVPGAYNPAEFAQLNVMEDVQVVMQRFSIRNQQLHVTSQAG
jgi:hypothetical protein